jgi:hypothetical protein
MSFLAIGEVTKAIAELLAQKLNKPPLLGSSVAVTTLPPDDERVDNANGVNLFLYRVDVNPFMSNMGWRGDKVNPNGNSRAPLALNLHYMLTAYAKKGDGAARDDITAHQILGNAMAVLHEYPVLNDVHDSDFDADVNEQFAAELRDSFEKVKISHVPTAMDEFSKIWTGFSKAYRLSVVYDVSLVQIAPLVASRPPAPPVGRTAVRVSTISAPLITSIIPSSGQAGAQVSLKGSHLKAQGSSTVVQVGEITLGESELLKITSEEIVLNVPEAPLTGPRLRVSVRASGRESEPVFYEVKPWIESLQPLRGIGGIPLSIPFDVPAGTTVKMQIADQKVDATFDAARKIVSARVPDTIQTNGAQPVNLILEGNAAGRSNTRFFDLLPIIATKTVTATNAPLMTTIAVTGHRLDGKDVVVRYGDLLIRKGENTSKTDLSVQIARTLPPDLPVAVIVDGRESNAIPPTLESIDPPAAARGDTVTLRGTSLSGEHVAVIFGTTSVTLAPQAFSSQVSVIVPATLAPGETSVKVRVNGDNSNKLTFKVNA